MLILGRGGRLVGIIVKPDGQVSVNSECLRGYSLLNTFF